MPQDLVIRFRQQFLTQKRIGHFPNVTTIHDASILSSERVHRFAVRPTPGKDGVGGNELRAQLRAASVETRHHGSDRNRQRFCGFLVGQVLDVTQENDLLERRRQSLQAAQDEFVGQILRYRRNKRHGVSDAVVRIVHHDRPALRPSPVADDVLEDRGQPGAAVRPGLEAMKRTQRLHHRFLHDILGISAIPLEPHGEAEEAIGMRQHLSLERSPGV